MGQKTRFPFKLESMFTNHRQHSQCSPFVADTIVFSSTAEAAEWVGGYLGEFVRMGNHNNRPYYKQRDTEGIEDLYMYYSDRWWVSDTLGRSWGFLRNRQDTDLPPRANWLYAKNGKASDDDRTLKLDYTTLSSPCKLVRVAGSGRVLNHQSSKMGDYRFASITFVNSFKRICSMSTR